jgi:hypothetical protein
LDGKVQHVPVKSKVSDEDVSVLNGIYLAMRMAPDHEQNIEARKRLLIRGHILAYAVVHDQNVKAQQADASAEAATAVTQDATATPMEGTETTNGEDAAGAEEAGNAQAARLRIPTAKQLEDAAASAPTLVDAFLRHITGDDDLGILKIEVYSEGKRAKLIFEDPAAAQQAGNVIRRAFIHLARDLPMDKLLLDKVLNPVDAAVANVLWPTCHEFNMPHAVQTYGIARARMEGRDLMVVWTGKADPNRRDRFVLYDGSKGYMSGPHAKGGKMGRLLPKPNVRMQNVQ